MLWKVIMTINNNFLKLIFHAILMLIQTASPGNHLPHLVIQISFYYHDLTSRSVAPSRLTDVLWE